MKNENWIILQYSKYIEDIDDLSHEDDLIIYNEIKKKHSKFGSLVLVEGFINTYPIQKSINIIEKRFPELIVNDQSGFRIYVEGYVNNLEKIYTNIYQSWIFYFIV
jgi:hypothetical protein